MIAALNYACCTNLWLPYASFLKHFPLFEIRPFHLSDYSVYAFHIRVLRVIREPY